MAFNSPAESYRLTGLEIGRRSHSRILGTNMLDSKRCQTHSKHSGSMIFLELLKRQAKQQDEGMDDKR